MPVTFEGVFYGCVSSRAYALAVSRHCQFTYHLVSYLTKNNCKNLS